MAVLKPLYNANTALNFSTNLNSLASSATWVAGVQSDEVDNTTNLDDDILVSGNIKVGTTPTTNTLINVYVVPSMNWGSTYPDVITNAGTAAKTWTSAGILLDGAYLLKSLLVDSTTTGRVYPFNNCSVLQAIGFLPQKMVFFIAHNTGVALDASAAGANLSYNRGQFQSV